ncbi:hypothetical protein [Lentzea kentuckyensis]|uniref:hypothetical protein n=1 Tax=Lentzea kentuckyensis TaxID=360086 RepID=UPI001FEC823E|nr:hypothetical protein [Lentzea kentuckyensis]
MFDVIREPLLEELGGSRMKADAFAAGDCETDENTTTVVLDDVEVFAATGNSQGTTLGALRQKVNELCDQDIMVCLVSRRPRNAFAPVTGSNLLVDASPCYLPLLNEDECLDGTHNTAGPTLPAVGLDENCDLDALLRATARELGVNVLTELDFALFEARHGINFPRELDPVIVDALRSAGLLHLVGEEPKFVLTRLERLSDAIAEAMAEAVTPQDDLAAVSDGLWQIERTIRRFLRSAAIDQSPANWRKELLNADLAGKVLGRARGDVNVTARSIAELRDPIEWLSLGELLELVQSKKFSGLFWDDLTWRLFKNDVVPIRNRLSHMRLLKKGDKATVRMWARRVASIKATAKVTRLPS